MFVIEKGKHVTHLVSMSRDEIFRTGGGEGRGDYGKRISVQTQFLSCESFQVTPTDTECLMSVGPRLDVMSNFGTSRTTDGVFSRQDS